MAVATLQREVGPQYPAIKPGMMGMYIFLASEVMFFGSLFAGYFYLVGSHANWPPPDPTGRFHPVEWWPVPAINTVILLSSGVTMHIGHLAIQEGKRQRFLLW